MQNLTVKSRLVFLTAAVAVVLLGVGAAGLLGVTRATDALQRMFEGRAKALQIISSIDELVAETRFSVSDPILDPSAQKTKGVTDAADARIRQVDDLMHQYVANGSIGEEKQLASRFSSNWTQLREKGLRPAVKLLADNNLSEALWIETQTIEPMTKAVRSQGAALRTMELQLAQQEYDHARYAGHVVQTVVGAFIVGGLGIVALICAGMARSLFRELGGEPHVAAHVARRVANGDLSVSVPVRPGDTRSVLFAMAKMRERLAPMIGEIRLSTETIADATANIAAGNSMLASRTEEHAAGIQQTSASMEQLASTVKANVEHAEQAHALARVASGKADDGDRAAKEIDALIKSMTAEVDLSSVAVRRAGATIGDLIGAVTGVSHLVESIANASAEQSAGIGQVNAAVVTMDRMTQSNASFAQEGVQAASALETQAQQLHLAVRAFQLQEGARLTTIN